MNPFRSQISQLTITKSKYRKFVAKFLELLLHQDIDSEDKTTALLANPQKKNSSENLY